MPRQHTEAGWLHWSKQRKKGGDKSLRRAREGVKTPSKPEYFINKTLSPPHNPMFTNKALAIYLANE